MAATSRPPAAATTSPRMTWRPTTPGASGGSSFRTVGSTTTVSRGVCHHGCRRRRPMLRTAEAPLSPWAAAPHPSITTKAPRLRGPREGRLPQRALRPSRSRTCSTCRPPSQGRLPRPRLERAAIAATTRRPLTSCATATSQARKNPTKTSLTWGSSSLRSLSTPRSSRLFLRRGGGPTAAWCFVPRRQPPRRRREGADPPLRSCSSKATRAGGIPSPCTPAICSLPSCPFT